MILNYSLGEQGEKENEYQKETYSDLLIAFQLNKPTFYLTLKKAQDT